MPILKKIAGKDVKIKTEQVVNLGETITLEKYKQMRDILEDYQKLLSEYKLLSYVYNQLTYQPEEEKVKVKQKIGFDTSKER